MKRRKVYQNLTKQLKIDAGVHKLLRIKAAKQETTIKCLVEGYILEGLKEETIQN